MVGRILTMHRKLRNLIDDGNQIHIGMGMAKYIEPDEFNAKYPGNKAVTVAMGSGRLIDDIIDNPD